MVCVWGGVGAGEMYVWMCVCVDSFKITWFLQTHRRIKTENITSLLPVIFHQVQKIWFDAFWLWTRLGDTQPSTYSVTHGLCAVATLVSSYRVSPTSAPTAKRSSVTCKNRPSTTMKATRSSRRRNEERNDVRTSQAQLEQLSEDQREKWREEWCENKPSTVRTAVWSSEREMKRGMMWEQTKHS